MRRQSTVPFGRSTCPLIQGAMAEPQKLVKNNRQRASRCHTAAKRVKKPHLAGFTRKPLAQVA